MDELEDVVLSDRVRLSSFLYMCSSQPGSDQRRINWSAGVLECFRTKLNWMTQGARLTDTVETIGIFGTYHRSTLPAPLALRGSYVANVISDGTGTIVALETISR